jgi:hypothetical protein
MTMMGTVVVKYRKLLSLVGRMLFLQIGNLISGFSRLCFLGEIEMRGMIQGKPLGEG